MMNLILTTGIERSFGRRCTIIYTTPSYIARSTFQLGKGLSQMWVKQMRTTLENYTHATVYSTANIRIALPFFPASSQRLSNGGLDLYLRCHLPPPPFMYPFKCHSTTGVCQKYSTLRAIQRPGSISLQESGCKRRPVSKPIRSPS